MTDMATLNVAALMWSMLFGMVGFGYFLYGKKQQRGIPLMCGIALMAFPYFVGNTTVMVVIGVVLTLTPWVMRS